MRLRKNLKHSQNNQEKEVLVSIIIPAYNEERYIDDVILRTLAVSFSLPYVRKEIIVVNDGSTDTTNQHILKFDNQIHYIALTSNKGKGAALRAGLNQALGDIILVQDADLEIDPSSQPALITPILEGRADVVYGSRFLGVHNNTFISPSYYIANRFLTWLSNMFTGLHLSDMETSQKAFRREAIQSIQLHEDGFSFEPEVTIKLSRKGWRFHEVSVQYIGRSKKLGKKISWLDGVRALIAIIRYGL